MVRIASIKHSNIRALTSFASLSLALLLAVVPVAASAEKADRDKPMNIEADNLLHDELKQVSVFSGRAVLTKGTMVMRGDRIEIRTDADGYQFGIILPEANKRAFFRQKREGLDEFMEGMYDFSQRMGEKYGYDVTSSDSDWSRDMEEEEGVKYPWGIKSLEEAT